MYMAFLQDVCLLWDLVVRSLFFLAGSSHVPADCLFIETVALKWGHDGPALYVIAQIYSLLSYEKQHGQCSWWAC